MTVDMAYQYLYTGALTVFAVLIGVLLIRSILGPRITDRILCINMIGTLVICSIAVLSQMLYENYLTDIALIYAMLSFLTVLVLASVYIRKQKTSGSLWESSYGSNPSGNSIYENHQYGGSGDGVSEGAKEPDTVRTCEACELRDRVRADSIRDKRSFIEEEADG